MDHFSFLMFLLVPAFLTVTAYLQHMAGFSPNNEYGHHSLDVVIALDMKEFLSSLLVFNPMQTSPSYRED